MQISPPAPGPLDGEIVLAPSGTSDQPLPRRRLALNWSSIFIAVCCGVFLLCVLFRLNGSSSALWAKDLGTPDEVTGLIAGALLLNNFLVNPISEGLPVLLHSQAALHIAAISNSDPAAAWAVYERSTRAQLVMASGARVLNGLKSVPDLPALSRLDPAQTSRDIYNRYACMVLDLPRSGEGTASFQLQGPDWYREFVSPFDQTMRDAALRYVIFPRLLTTEEMGPMKLIDALPSNLIWIYKLD